MGPKKGNAADGRALSLEGIKQDGASAFHVAELVMLDIMAKYEETLNSRRLHELMNPYMAEAGLSVALEPSTMLLYANDNVPFHVETGREREEPKCPELDRHCLDRYQSQSRTKHTDSMKELGLSEASKSPARAQVRGPSPLQVSPAKSVGVSSSTSPTKRAARLDASPSKSYM